jgi:flagellar basal-body rod protein FlgB
LHKQPNFYNITAENLTVGLIVRAIFLIFILLPITAFTQDVTTDAIAKEIDFLQKKHEVLAGNIANISTPKYITKDIEKPHHISDRKHKVKIPKVHMRLTNSKHIRASGKDNDRFDIVLDKTSPIKPNKNNVDLATQVGKMAVNSDSTSEALKNYRSSMELLGMAADSGAGK